ncbi:hypothetical protein NSB25_25925 [Acetatifactor muris]|uniref:Uncharacterized protein n=1 Tax=Acetatifactor muris TaxID=879566 RepID=A0A2K4ZP22_9FIRM|nr:hypothetical protein [Acetatifactor muris]MCR2050676.1 hypothetical protein [Acetatifactor muris]SOY32223.1 hypothetical protein AMURIS_04981 [Acetatifactor muris]
MKFIKTPTGDVYKLDDCMIFYDLDNSEVFFNTQNKDQKMLAKELFENTGILVGDLKGGENTG